MFFLCVLLLVLPFGIRGYLRGSQDQLLPGSAESSFFVSADPTFSLSDGVSLLMFAVALYLAVFRNALVPERLLRPERSALPISLPHFVSVVAAASTIPVSLLMIYSPSLFRKLTLEDNLVENLTFAMLLIAGVLVCALAHRLGGNPLGRTAAYLLALLLFFCAMEEISWGQRIFGLVTPESLSKINWQHEINLHNIHSRASNHVFYFASFVFLVVVPFVHDRTLVFERYLRPLAPLVGGGLTLFTGIVTFCLNNYMWNTPVTYSTFVTALAILFYYLLKQPFSPVLAVFFAMLAVSTFLCFYGYDYLIDKHRLYEYKELYFALGYFVFGVERLAGSRLKAARGSYREAQP